MKKHIWISGTINSGKSTVAKLLGTHLRMPVIELDAFSAFVDSWMEFREMLDMNYAMIPDIITMYESRGFTVIIVYPISQKRYDELGEYKSKFDFFSIDPGIEIVLSNRGDRNLDDWERNRIHEQYEKGVHNPEFATHIDTHELDPEQTAQIVFIKLNEK